MKFIIDVPKGNTEDCEICPFNNLEDVCQYLGENRICDKYNFAKLHIEKYENRN